MFQIGYFSDKKEMIPSGWNVIDEDKVYPLISSRNPQARQPLEDESSNGYEPANGNDDSDFYSDRDNSYNNSFQPSTRMNEESSEEDEDAAPPPIHRVSLPVLLL